MAKGRLLDVNGLSSEYNMQLEKRVKKYRKVKYRDTSRPAISDAEIYRMRSVAWRNKTRRNQIIIALAALLVVVGVVFLSWYLTYGLVL